MKRLFENDSGFSLIETVLSIGILAFVLIPIFTLLPTGLNSMNDAKSEENATELLASMANDFQSVSRATDLSPIYRIPALAVTPVAHTSYFTMKGIATEDIAEAAYRVTATPQPSADTSLALWHLKASWPPQASEEWGSVETIVLLSRPQ